MKNRIIYVDYLRVVAMISVLVCHYTRSLEYAGVGFVNKILPDTVFSVYLGSFGVSIFFVVSGLSLMYTYVDKDNLKNYFKKRFWGIYPMYWLAWTLALLWLFYLNRGLTFNAPKYKLLLTLLGMDGYLNWYGPNYYLLGEWFLGCLILLYICFPLLKVLVVKHPILLALIVCSGQAVLPHFYKGVIPAENFFGFRLFEFLFGMYLAYYKPKINRGCVLLFAAPLILMCIFDVSKIPTLYRNGAVGILVTCCFYVLFSDVGSNVLAEVCKHIGKYAYAVFLTHHVIVQQLAYHFSGMTFTRYDNYFCFAIYIILVVIMSFCLFRLDNKIKNKFLIS